MSMMEDQSLCRARVTLMAVYVGKHQVRLDCLGERNQTIECSVISAYWCVGNAATINVTHKWLFE